MLFRHFALLAIACTPVAVLAQDAPPRHQLYGGYSFLSNSFNGVPGARHPLNGWDAGFAFPSWHNLRFRVDISGYHGNNTGAEQHAIVFLGGAQYDWHFRHETLFAEGLAGDAALNRYWGPNALPGVQASFASVLGGGLDTRINRRFAWRIEGGYQYSNFALVNSVPGLVPIPYSGLPRNFARLSTGLVWNF
ncbi:MAG TPA: hypothetical protein VKB38_23670 [Terracidiphilus sp.]|nr:hypothetical protein [Terracidiphilus sp.]